MRTSAFIALVLTAAAPFAPRPATAAYNLPWCAQYNDSGAFSCAFTSFQQCLVTISGIGGVCMQNFRYAFPPPYAAPPPYAEPRRTKPRHDFGYH
jgi:hypothetical protein